MEVPPINPYGYNDELGGPYGHMLKEMQDLLDRYGKVMQDYMHNPSQDNLNAVEACMTDMKTFLHDHKKQILALGQANGWGKPGHPTQGVGSDYEHYFDAAINTINNFLKEPGPGPLNFLMEAFSQIDWLMHNKA